MSEQFYNEVGGQLSGQFGATIGQMFGKSCLKIGGKAFAAFFKEEMVFKLGRDEVNLLLSKYPGSTNWDPSEKGRPMKDWLQIPVEFNDDWGVLAKQALDYVEEISK